MRAFHVVVVNLEHGLHGDGAVFREEDGVHELAGIRLGASVPYDDAAVVACAGTAVEQVARELYACRLGGVVVDVQPVVALRRPVEDVQGADFEMGSGPAQVAVEAHARNAVPAFDARKAHVGTCRLLNVEVAEPEGEVVRRIGEENLHVGAFTHMEVEAFGVEGVHHLVVENLEAGLCVLADVQHGAAEVVVALQERHLAVAVGDAPLERACVACNREEGREIVFARKVFGAGACVRKFRRRNF